MKYIRQRYILFEILTQNDISIEKDQVVRLIWKNVTKLFGEFTAYKIGLWMIRWDPHAKIGILRCDNVTRTEIIATLALIRSIDSSPVIFHSWKTSGTIKTTLANWHKFFSTQPPKRDKKTN